MATFYCQRALLTDGWARNVRITIDMDRFGSIERGVSPEPADLRCGIALPGLPNLHSHAFQRGMAGLAERRGRTADSFWTWREVMYRFLDRLTPDDLQAIAALAYCEMMESGFTRVGEFHYLHHDPAGMPYDGAAMAQAIAAAADETGIALTLLPVFYAHGDFGGAAPLPAQRRFVCDVDGFARLIEASGAAISALPDAVLGLAPHSLRATTAAELTALCAMAGAAPIHIHVAEQQREVESCIAWSGARPVRWLLDHAPVDARWCLVHATHMDANETVAMARSGAVAGLCPITEANLGDGLFPAPAFLAAGGSYGLGSDSNVRIDAAEEMRWLEYGQRLASRSRNVLATREESTGGAVFRAALAGGAQALGAPAGIAEGLPCNFFTLNDSHPALIAADGDGCLDGWVFAAGGAAIDSVWQSGRQWVSGGRHRARAEIVARYDRVLRAVLA